MSRLFRKHALAVAGAIAVALCAPRIAVAQGDCEAMPAGPSRTDCFIARARIQGQKSDIAAGAARQRSDAEKLGVATGTPVKPKARGTKTKRKPRN